MSQYEDIIAGKILTDDDIHFCHDREEYQPEFGRYSDFYVGDIEGNDYSRIWSGCLVGVGDETYTIHSIYLITRDNDTYPDHTYHAEDGEQTAPLCMELMNVMGGGHIFLQLFHEDIVKHAPYGYYQRGQNSVLIAPTISRNWRVGICSNNSQADPQCLDNSALYAHLGEVYRCADVNNTRTDIGYADFKRVIKEVDFFKQPERLTYREAFDALTRGRVNSYALTLDFCLIRDPIRNGIILAYKNRMVAFIDITNANSLRVVQSYSWLEDSIREVLV